MKQDIAEIAGKLTEYDAAAYDLAFAAGALVIAGDGMDGLNPERGRVRDALARYAEVRAHLLAHSYTEKTA